MHSTDRKNDPQKDALLEEHRRLSHLIEKLDEFLERSAKTVRESDFVAWKHGLADALGSLGHRLEEHFRVEEASNLFTKLPMECPRFAATLEHLQRQHGEILGSIDKTKAVTLEATSNVAVAEIRDRATAMLQMLRRHERQETDILEEAYCDDLGAID